MKKYTTKELMTASLILTIGILFPIIFHFFGIAGAIFLPMHIPVFIGGVVLLPELAILVGLLTPLLSSLLTGMPVLFPIAIIMMFELAAYGWVVSMLTRKYKMNIILSIIIAMFFGRVVATVSVYILVLMFNIKLNPMLYIKGAIVTGLPGILIQLLIIPILIKVIKQTRMNKM
jgi:hypothetical protein